MAVVYYVIMELIYVKSEYNFYAGGKRHTRLV